MHYWNTDNEGPTLLVLLTQLMDKKHECCCIPDGFSWRKLNLELCPVFNGFLHPPTPTHTHTHTHTLTCTQMYKPHVNAHIIQGEDPEETISKSGNHHPFIIVVGEDHLHPSQFLIIVENNKLLEVGSFTKAMVALVSAYYIFDIVYMQSRVQIPYSLLKSFCLS